MRVILLAAATPFVAARISKAQGKQMPKILGINSNSWSAGWADTTRVNMASIRTLTSIRTGGS